MTSFYEFIQSFEEFIPLIRTLIVIIVVYSVFSFIIRTVEKKLLSKAKTKDQISNIDILLKILRYSVFIVLILFAIFSYTGSWSGFGLFVGLLSAALGFALQKPITGIAAWIMVVTKRPFEIGDRVIIGDVRGDVTDITLTHIHLNEVGGLVPSEENSGRSVMVPISTLFERDVVNYTLTDQYVLDEVVTTVTYEGNLDKAINICLESAKKYIEKFAKKTKREPYARTFFKPSGIDIHIRYFCPAKELQKMSSCITKEIYERTKNEHDVEIAYPHSEVIFRNKYP